MGENLSWGDWPLPMVGRLNRRKVEKARGIALSLFSLVFDLLWYDLRCLAVPSAMVEWTLWSLQPKQIIFPLDCPFGYSDEKYLLQLASLTRPKDPPFNQVGLLKSSLSVVQDCLGSAARIKFVQVGQLDEIGANGWSIWESGWALRPSQKCRDRRMMLRQFIQLLFSTLTEDCIVYGCKPKGDSLRGAAQKSTLYPWLGQSKLECELD